MSEYQKAEIARMGERMCTEKAWELRKAVFDLEGSYDKNETNFM